MPAFFLRLRNVWSPVVRCRAQDLECVLVFDGNMFVMDRVSVAGVRGQAADNWQTGSIHMNA